MLKIAARDHLKINTIKIKSWLIRQSERKQKVRNVFGGKKKKETDWTD